MLRHVSLLSILIVATGCLVSPATASPRGKTDRIKKALRGAADVFNVAVVRVTREKTSNVPGKGQDPTPEVIQLDPEGFGPLACYPTICFGEFLERVCISQARLGDVQGALVTRRQLAAYHYGSNYTDSIHEIAMAQARAGQTADAVRTSKELSADDRIAVMLAIAQQRSDAGKNDQAGAWIDKTRRLIARSNGRTRVSGYAALARWYSLRGDKSATRRAMDQAQRVARDEKARAIYRASRLLDIASVQKEMGDKAGAADTLDEILGTLKAAKAKDRSRIPIGRQHSFIRHIVSVMLKAGFSERAVEATKLLDVDEDETSWAFFDDRQWLYGDIALHRLQKRDIAGAAAILKEIRYKPLRRKVLIAMARAHAESGDVKSALKVAVGLVAGNGSNAARAFLEIAAVQGLGGDMKGAKKTAERADFLHTAPDEKPVRFSYMAPATWGVDYYRRILPRTITYTQKGPTQAQLDSEALAASAMRLFHILECDRTYDKYHEDFESLPSPVVMRLAKAQAEIGDFSGALRWAGRLSVARSKALAMLGAAEGYLARNEAEGTRSPEVRKGTGTKSTPKTVPSK